MPFNIGPGELVLVLIIALIVVGPGKLPDVGAAIGKSLREFRKAASDVQEAASPQPVAQPAPVPVAPVPVAPVPVTPVPVTPVAPVAPAPVQEVEPASVSAPSGSTGSSAS